MIKIESVAEKLLNLIFPERCISCGCCLNGENRDEDFLLAPFFCKICGGDVARNKRNFDFKLREHAYDDAAVPLLYEGSVKKAMLDFKFGSNISPAGFFAAELERAVRTKFYGIKFDILTCVPASKSGVAERGYNQSRVIAEGMKFSVTPDFTLLRKSRNTDVQHLLDAEQRWHNIETAYSLNVGRDVRGLNILLVDDILTTGATCDACARALRFAGAKSVYVACATKAVQNQHLDYLF